MATNGQWKYQAALDAVNYIDSGMIVGLADDLIITGEKGVRHLKKKNL